MRNCLAVFVALSLGGLVGCVQPVATGPVRAPTQRLELTGAGQALSRVTSAPEDETFPAVSPNGASLLFSVRAKDGAKVQRSIVGVDPRTGGRRTMYTSSNSQSEEPAWLPDGSSFVYSSNRPGSWSLVRALSSDPNSAVRVIVGGNVAPMASRPSLSPDGRRVSFATKIRDSWNIGVANLDGSNFTLLGEGRSPAWSPDGNRLAFVRMLNGVSQLFMVNPNTGGELVQITSGDFAHIEPAWSPDGRLIVLTSNRGWNTIPGGRQGGTWNLYAIRPDGTGLTQITDGNSSAGGPCWGQDGWLYFHSNQAGNFDIWRLRLVGELAAQGPAGAEGGVDPGAQQPPAGNPPPPPQPAPQPVLPAP